MCLYRNVNFTEKFKQRNKNKREIIIWKVVSRSLNNSSKFKYVTPCRYTNVNAGWFKGVGKINQGEEINGGVIHAFTNRQDARNYYDKCSYEKVIKCKALMKDLIAVGNNRDVCFTKIWIPKEELK